ncbi:MAG TPA: hypothetical protein VIM73_14995, partial [Polyangiaceae bacterium]
THYMDEAERCHRLAFIFGGRLLGVGTPDEMIASSGIAAVELEVERMEPAADLLTRASEVDEVLHFGHVLRVAVRSGVEPERFVREKMGAAGISIRRLSRVRVTMEDAFVATVRAEAAREKSAA